MTNPEESKKAAKNFGPGVQTTGVHLYEACRRLHKEIDEFEQHRDTQCCRRGEEEYPLEYPSMIEWKRQFWAWLELKSLGENV